ncbi:hypothetical protein LJC37_04995 [Bacteroidales bacterium OttesenSCG-928-E04]|nr:hypothetical protein [Bacteroidales bacterium OttesenSCG-928-E04]MDL2325832.1 hypothetical protein [Bacteroidales bacterium OttesenSCG-928-A14]
MKIKQVLVLFVFAGIASVFFVLYQVEKRNSQRLSENMDIAMKNEGDRVRTLTVKELKTYYEDIVDDLKKNDISPKQAMHIIQTEYLVKDTTVYRDTLIYVRDTVENIMKAPFCFESDCFAISGTVYSNDFVEINEHVYRDTVTAVVFKEKGCLFKKPVYRAKVISSCTGDTLQVLHNIQVIKNKRSKSRLD